MTLAAHPGSRIRIPLMSSIGNSAKGGLDIGPAAFIFETPADQLCNEGAPPPRPGPAVELGNEFIIQGYVQTHVRTLAHALMPTHRLSPLG